MTRVISLVTLAAISSLSQAAWGQFSFEPAGALVPGSGTGYASQVVHAPDMRFPMESAPAFANSQVWGAGGLNGPGGGQCAASNYRYPWRDNYCETRQWAMPLCPAGRGHQGQDIRPATCADDSHWVVATENGTITHVGSYSVYLQGRSGITYRFLHMSSRSVQVRAGQGVTKGQRLGRVSNNMGDTPTTIHLHFDMKKFVAGYGNIYVPPYMSLVRSYERLIGTPANESSPPAEVCDPAPLPGGDGQIFADLPPGAFGKAHAEALFRADITSGCRQEPRLYCPECHVTRWMMVVFLVRAQGLDISNPPPNSSFSDVPKTLWYWPHVEAAKAAGITRGCSADGNQFCPDRDVTRGEAAVLIANTLGWPLANPATASFSDVPKTAWNYRQIETMKSLCVTTGCAATRYCPDDIVTRAQAAVFVARAFDLEDLNACVSYCDAASCDDGSFCEDWSECEGFADVCDESGTQTRTCVTAECQGPSTSSTCATSARDSSRACSRVTDGVVAEGFSPWGPCGGFSDACDTTGTQSRARMVCRGGAATVETEARACTRVVTCGDADAVDPGPDASSPEVSEGGGDTADTSASDAPMVDTGASDASADTDRDPDAPIASDAAEPDHTDATSSADSQVPRPDAIVGEVTTAEPDAPSPERGTREGGCTHGGVPLLSSFFLWLARLVRRPRTPATRRPARRFGAHR